MYEEIRKSARTVLLELLDVAALKPGQAGRDRLLLERDHGAEDRQGFDTRSGKSRSR